MLGLVDSFPTNDWHSYGNKLCPIMADLFLYSCESEFFFHWSVAVLTVTVHSSFFPTFDFLKICCFLHCIQSVNPIFMLR